MLIEWEDVKEWDSEMVPMVSKEQERFYIMAYAECFLH